MRSDDRPLALLQAGLAGTHVAGLSDAQVHDEVAALLVCANQLDAVLADRLGSFDARGLSNADAVRTTLSWLRIYGRMGELAPPRVDAAAPRAARPRSRRGRVDGDRRADAPAVA
jgi:hypothetical protein